MIRHAVIFTLKYPTGSPQEKTFLLATEKLAGIPGVERFEQFRQTSKKNPFDFGLSMEFASKTLYDQYNIHPDHTYFIQQFWIEGVKDFLEIDYEPLDTI